MKHWRFFLIFELDLFLGIPWSMLESFFKVLGQRAFAIRKA
jgi:hypothetical protein